ncbi:hypothetical protein [Gluconobacter cerinus]|nr:hypothetical protein [Gluconobacter cerinus]MBS1044540.1 hypothetical protein [Gluconobacter cerinus]OUJ04960.1 hypothetical protein HK24_13295 [Gluconobacter sp. DsW_058]BCZ75887.1 hypothetical protein [Acetobacter phage phiAX1]
MEDMPPQTPQLEQDLDDPVLARGLIVQARIWATLHRGMCQEVRDHIALRVAEELGARIG